MTLETEMRIEVLVRLPCFTPLQIFQGFLEVPCFIAHLRIFD